MAHNQEPMRDEDGEPIPVIYYFEVVDEHEQKVGKSIERVETKPVSNSILKEEATKIATEYIATNPERAPWAKWFVNINSTGTTEGNAEQEKGYYFLDLLDQDL